MLSELRHALRVLPKAPVFSAPVVAVLAVGIDASRLISVHALVRDEPDDTSSRDLADWRDATRTVDRIAGSASMPATLAHGVSIRPACDTRRADACSEG
jgi:hypothetical protein